MRKFFRKLHTWLAIPVGIIISITCLTGAILVFQEEILELANPGHYFVKEIKGSPIPIEELIAIVDKQLDNNSVAGVKIPSDPERTYTMTLKEGFRISAFVNPYTGEITGIYNFREHPFFTIMSIHRWLLDGSRTWGKYTVGISTLLFAIILISGIIIWFPREFKKNRFKVQFKKGRKRLWYDCHNVLGFYACLVLLICALTGLMWSFDWYNNTVLKIFGAQVPTEQGHGKGGKNTEDKTLNTSCWQNLYEQLKSKVPDHEYIRIQNGAAEVHLKSAPTSRANDIYKFNTETGQIIKNIPYKQQETTSKTWGWIYALHVGNYWGIWSKIFTFTFALVGASLPITGYYIWFSKKKKKKKR